MKTTWIKNGLGAAERAVLTEPATLLTGMKVLKDSNSTTAGVVQVGKQRYFLKRSNVKRWWERLRRIGRSSRCEKNILTSERLKELGIRVPDIYYGEERGIFFIPGESYLVMEYMGDPMNVSGNLHRILDETSLAELGEELCRIVALMHGGGVVHNDLKMQNFLAIRGGSGKWSYGLFDFDGSELLKDKVSDSRCYRELGRMLSSLYLTGAKHSIPLPPLAETEKEWLSCYARHSGRPLTDQAQLHRAVSRKYTE